MNSEPLRSVVLTTFGARRDTGILPVHGARNSASHRFAKVPPLRHGRDARVTKSFSPFVGAFPNMTSR